jgi:hypothetical protein
VSQRQKNIDDSFDIKILSDASSNTARFKNKEISLPKKSRRSKINLKNSNIKNLGKNEVQNFQPIFESDYCPRASDIEVEDLIKLSKKSKKSLIPRKFSDKQLRLMTDPDLLDVINPLTKV